MAEVDLAALIKERGVKGGLPPFWKPTNPGDAISGRVVRVRKSPWKEGHFLYELKGATGQSFSTSDNVQLRQLFEDQHVKAGDFLVIRFEGLQKTQRGMNVKQYSMAKLTLEEGKTLGLADIEFTTEIQDAPKLEQKGGSAPVAPGAPAAPGEVDWNEVKKFTEQLIGFYPNLTRDEYNGYLNSVRKFNVTPEEACIHLGLTIVDGKIKKA